MAIALGLAWLGSIFTAADDYSERPRHIIISFVLHSLDRAERE